MTGVSGGVVRRLAVIAAILSSSSTFAAWAHPLSLSLGPRQGGGPPSTDGPSPSGGGGGISPALLAPLIIVPILVVAVMVFFRGTLLPKLAAFGQAFVIPSHVTVPRATAARPTSGAAPQSLTAEQLAGSMATDENQARRGDAPPARRARRRPRRTPSQVSTKSLPAYMVEAGDNELVLVRARNDDPDEHDEDDADEDGDEENAGTPLLSEPSGSGPPNHNLHEPNATNHSIRPSMDSHMSSNDSHNTNRSSMSLLDRERGEAPAYFEVVENGPQQPNQPTANTTTTTDNDLEQNQQQEQPVPPSSFRMPDAIKRFFARGGASQPAASPRPLALPMQQYSQSQVSLPASYTSTGGPTTPSSRSSPRARRVSHSVLPSSPSLSSLLLSRTRSNSNAPNPSSSTSHIISPPLPHSLIRTNFGYPSAGPTPEQMAFLSSTASLLRFGVPINEDGSENLRAPPAFADVVPSATATEQPSASNPEPEGWPRSVPRPVPFSLSTRNLPGMAGPQLGSVTELPTPISPSGHEKTIPGLPSSRDQTDLLAAAAFVPLPESVSGHAEDAEDVPLPESVLGHGRYEEDGAVEGRGRLSVEERGGLRRASSSTVQTFDTADTHLSDGDETETEGGPAAVGSRRSRAGAPSGHQETLSSTPTVTAAN